MKAQRLRKFQYGYEDLELWNGAVNFAKDVIDIAGSIDTSRKNYRPFEQIESSATSIAMNLAESKGCFLKEEFMHFRYIFGDYLYETITHFDIFIRKSWINNSQFIALNF